MKVYRLNMGSFLGWLSRSAGSVYVSLPNGEKCDLKENPLALQLFQAMAIPESGVRFSFSDSRDLTSFVSFMVGM